MISRATSILIMLLLFCKTVLGQDSTHAQFTADRGTPAIGEPIQLTLSVQVPTGSIVIMPQFSPDWSSFMVTSVGDVTETTQDSSTLYKQTLTVLLWRPGDYQTPQTFVTYQSTGSDQLLQLAVAPAFFTVPSVLNDNDLVLRPLKPPIALPYIPLWLMGLFALLIPLVLAVIFYFLRTRRFLAVTIATTDSLNNFHISAQTALRELKRISEKVNSPSEVYALSADCLRVYLHGRFEVSADDMTTGEIKAVLQATSLLTERRQHELENLLERADLVKFARLQPKLTAAQQFVMVAQRWIQTVEQGESA